MDIHQTLTKYWGYSKFRPLQEDIIRSVLQGRDTLALMPTGGGKSLCYQVPALSREGVTIVISPLIALMKDQTAALVSKDIKAKAIHSGMNAREIDVALDNCIYGGTKLLYLSPERLSSELVQVRIGKMTVNLLAVDEAHCISQWGYDFRPSYLEIAAIREQKPGVPVLALTATATRDVVDDIQEKLLFRQKNVFRKSFERKNLAYSVMQEENKEGRLVKLLRGVNGTAIVYVRTRKRTKEIAALLKREGISCENYHGGLDQAVRNSKQDLWMKGKVKVMAATNAFGMGIDKPDVRLVVHIDMCDNPESYFQEAGRAGRDEKEARAVLLYSEADRIQAIERLKVSFPPLEEIRKVYNAVGNYLQVPVGGGENVSFDFDISDFSNRAGFSVVHTYHCLRLLERAGYLTPVESSGAPSRLHFRMRHEDLYGFQVANQRYDAFIKLLLRSYGGLFDDFVNISERELARRGNTTEDTVVAMLGRLGKEGIAEYAPAKNKPQLFFNTARTDSRHLSISDVFLKDRMELAMKRLEAMIHYASSTNKCRNQILLAYFGEENAYRCGVCDVCTERNKLDLSDLEFAQVSDKLKELLTATSLDITTLVNSVSGSREDKVIKVVQWLADNGKIRYDENNLLKWIK